MKSRTAIWLRAISVFFGKELDYRGNNGYFRRESFQEVSRTEKIPEFTVGEMASVIFGSFRICLSEFV